LFRQAISLKEQGGATPVSRSYTLHAYACGLRDNGRWPEAERLFRQAISLQEQGGDTPVSQADTLAEYAIGLRNYRDYKNAEKIFIQAIRLFHQAGRLEAQLDMMTFLSDCLEKQHKYREANRLKKDIEALNRSQKT
jgi:tetratricopeptide (TPR) repeat protein